MGSAAFFRNNSRPSGVLVAPGKISKEVAELLKLKWEENFSGGRIGRTAVLGDGLKWEPLTLTATDAQLIDQLRYSVEDVARVYRVPLFLLGELSKVSYRNSEQMNRGYYSGCLQYHIEAIEARLDRAFALPEGVYVEFDLEPLLRTEIDIRFNAYKTAIQSGFKTINEVRKKEGDKPLPGGDEPLVQVQYMPLSQLGKQAKQPKQPATPSSEPVAPAPAGGTDTPPPEPAPSKDAVDVDFLAAVLDTAIARSYISLPAPEVPMQ
jgi:phage portal protein BeeE